MLKDVEKISFVGGKFKEPVNMELLCNNGGLAKSALVYGRNGSGKSTIAKAIRKIKSDEVSMIVEAEMKDGNDNIVLLGDDDKRRIFVFDEEYIDNNIKLQETGLKTIIMLGEQVDLNEKISKVEEELNIVNKEYNDKEKEIEKIKIEKDSRESELKKGLKQGWVDRDRIIKEHKRNTPVNSRIYDEVMDTMPVDGKSELNAEFNRKEAILSKIRSGTIKSIEYVPKLPSNYDISKIKNLLSKKIENPVLTDREKYLLKVIESKKSDRLYEMLRIFEDESTKSCPYCLQPLETGYKNDLAISIQKVLSKEVEKHRQELRSLIVNKIEIDFSKITELNESRNLESIVKEVNKILLDNNNKLQQKIDNPYNPIEIEDIRIKELYDKLRSSLTKIEKERNEYNEKIQNVEMLIGELTKLNKSISYYDIEIPYKKYKEKKKILEEKQREFEIKREECLKKKVELKDLKARKKSIKIAIKLINKNLEYIFLSKNRLRIDYRDNEYVLLSNGNNVKPSEISLGERNIIGLCYFFADIMQNKETSKAYEDEYLIVIDDPVSSFDFENKVGIMSFLNYQLENFLLGNVSTRFIILTHDLSTMYDFINILQEINKEYGVEYKGKVKKIYNLNKLKFNAFELKNKSLSKFDKRKRQEYTELVKKIYEYASGKGDDYDIVVGNMMRQVLEAFSTFEYKMGIAQIAKDKDILKIVPEEYRNYFKNLMYRLVLHGGSHREEQVKVLKDNMNFYNLISTEEKRRTAQDILCFMYLLNERHLVSHLGENGDINKIKEWCDERKSE
ncbi:AAA family ATPase [Ligilactobacillus salivarius]|uniref:AAA family ATPase n=1 Tax=Ligilactobacillus salivarius TaxID=1624 RepID=UPI001875CB41|nr:AAA family ATPase [Ligilactobacillus salivarius]MBE5066931.1 AAA family ATPase [Ligilactobacillus salivarius]